MEKMSDKRLYGIVGNFWTDHVTVAKSVRAFYDAQIDAQAKTMGELWEIFQRPKDYLPAENWVIEHHPDCIEYDSDEQFAIAVNFYLAAGGTIKE